MGKSYSKEEEVVISQAGISGGATNEKKFDTTEVLLVLAAVFVSVAIIWYCLVRARKFTRADIRKEFIKSIDDLRVGESRV